MHHQIVCARLALIGAFIGCFALNQMAMAQSNIRPPDAGALQRQIERERFTPWVPRNGLSGPDTEVRPTDSQETTMVFVRRFLFQGNTLLSSEVLTQLLKDSTLQNLTTNQLYAAAEKVRQAYTDAGLMADVSLPNQDVTQGDIRFKIIEATLGEVVFMGEPPRHREPAKTRGVADILIAVTDGLKGIGEALGAVFPATTLQTCIVHLIRNSLDYASWKDRKLLAAALKPVYTAASAEAAEAELAAFEAGPWGQKFPTVVASWRRAWSTKVSWGMACETKCARPSAPT